MYRYLKQLFLRNTVQRQFGFYSDYRGCVMDLLAFSLDDTHKTHIKSVSTSSNPNKMLFAPKLKTQLSRVIHNDWNKGISPLRCRDELLQEIATKDADKHAAVSPGKPQDIAA